MFKMVCQGLLRLLGWLLARVLFHFLVALHLSEVVMLTKRLRDKLPRRAAKSA